METTLTSSAFAAPFAHPESGRFKALPVADLRVQVFGSRAAWVAKDSAVPPQILAKGVILLADGGSAAVRETALLDAHRVLPDRDWEVTLDDVRVWPLEIHGSSSAFAALVVPAERVEVGMFVLAPREDGEGFDIDQVTAKQVTRQSVTFSTLGGTHSLTGSEATRLHRAGLFVPAHDGSGRGLHAGRLLADWLGHGRDAKHRAPIRVALYADPAVEVSGRRAVADEVRRLVFAWHADGERLRHLEMWSDVIDAAYRNGLGVPDDDMPWGTLLSEGAEAFVAQVHARVRDTVADSRTPVPFDL